MNGVHCKSGYIYLKREVGVQQLTSREGNDFDRLYKSLFGEVPEGKASASGFTVSRDRWEWQQKVFAVKNVEWEDDDRLSSVMKQHHVRAACMEWRDSREG